MVSNHFADESEVNKGLRGILMKFIVLAEYAICACPSKVSLYYPTEWTLSSSPNPKIFWKIKLMDNLFYFPTLRQPNTWSTVKLSSTSKKLGTSNFWAEFISLLISIGWRSRWNISSDRSFGNSKNPIVVCLLERGYNFVEIIA